MTGGCRPVTIGRARGKLWISDPVALRRYTLNRPTASCQGRRMVTQNRSHPSLLQMLRPVSGSPKSFVEAHSPRVLQPECPLHDRSPCVCLSEETDESDHCGFLYCPSLKSCRDAQSKPLQESLFPVLTILQTRNRYP